MEQHGHIVDIIIAIIIMFLFPLLYFGLKQDALVQTIAEIETASLVDEVRSKGYLTKERYDRYLENMSDTGLIYDITLGHSRTIYEPEYRLRTPEEVINQQDTAYTGGNIYHYRPAQSDIPEVLDPINNGNLNTETNESVMAAAEDTPASADHVHTDECYAGHKHSEGEGLTFTHTHAHNTNCVKYTDYICGMRICGSCGKQYQYLARDMWWNSNTNEIVYNFHSETDRCNNCGSTYYVPGSAVTYVDWGYSCGYTMDVDGDTYHEEVEPYISYTYEKNWPQDQATKASYVQGCYEYHVHGYPRGYPDYCYGVLYDMRYGEGLSEYCFIPEYYTMNLERKEDGSDVAYVKYRAEIMEDGTERFVFSDAGPWDRIPISKHSRFPQTMTLSQMYEFSSAGYKFVDFLGKYAGVSFVENWSDYLDYTSTNSGSSGMIRTCDKQDGGWIPVCGLSEDGTMDCGRVVTNITATHPVQTVYVGGPLITTVVITHADGSTTTKIGNTSFPTANPAQNQTATISLDHEHTDECYAGHRHGSSCVLAGDMSKKVYVDYAASFDVNEDQLYFWVEVYCAGCDKLLAGIGMTYASIGSRSGLHCSIDTTYYHYDIDGSVTSTLYRIFSSDLSSDFRHYNDIIIDLQYRLKSYLDTKPGTFYSYGAGGYWRITNDFIWDYGNYPAMASDGTSPVLPFIGCVYEGIYGENYSCGQKEDETLICASGSCSITVNVVPKTITCDIGHIYNLNTDGTDPGCPYCRAWLSSLVVAYPVSGSITIYRGTTLPDNGVTLLATYLDGRTEYVYSGYDDNLDRYYVGNQEVTLSYKGLNASLTVITRRNIIPCPDCGRYYELYPDDTNPGCPYCEARTPIFTGNVMEYTDKCYASDILKELYEGSGTYYFNDKDYFTIRVVNKKAGWGRRLLGNIFKGLDESNIMIKYGGHVREEAN